MSRPVEAFVQTAEDPRADEDPDGEQIGEDDPGALRTHRAADEPARAARRPACAAIRAASDAPSRPWKRSASAGVPQAGQPSTPKTVTCAAREPGAERVAEASDRRMVLEDEDVLDGGDVPLEPVHVEAVEPGHRHHPQRQLPALVQPLRGEERLVEHHRAVGEQDGVTPLVQDAATADRDPRREVEATRRGADRKPHGDRLLGVLDGPAEQRAGLVPRARLDDRQVREGREQRDVSNALVRLPRACGDESRVVERVDRPWNPRSPGCRSARCLATRGTTRTSSRRAAARDGPCRRPSRPCPAPRFRTGRTAPGKRARTRGRGSPRRGRRRGRRGRRVPRRARAAPVRTPRRRTPRRVLSRPAGASPRPIPARPRGRGRPSPARRPRAQAARGRAPRTAPQDGPRARPRRVRTARRPARPRATDRSPHPRRARRDAP